MNTYKVLLTRSYFVTIIAEDDYKARRLSEFYLGDCIDLSNEKDRSMDKFKIIELEMVYNEANESELFEE